MKSAVNAAPWLHAYINTIWATPPKRLDGGGSSDRSSKYSVLQYVMHDRGIILDEGVGKSSTDAQPYI